MRIDDRSIVPKTAWAAILLAAATLLSPALRPVHVEGFTAAVEALGLHLAAGTVSAFDTTQPFNTEYFGLTKLGFVLTVAGLGWLGMSGAGSMILLHWTGLFLFLAGSLWLIRSWSNGSWLGATVALVLLPGVSETLYFYNDNLLTAGLLVVALALISRSRTNGLAIASGVLLGLAASIRTDTIILSVAFLERRPARAKNGRWGECQRRPGKQSLLATAPVV